MHTGLVSHRWVFKGHFDQVVVHLYIYIKYGGMIASLNIVTLPLAGEIREKGVFHSKTEHQLMYASKHV